MDVGVGGEESVKLGVAISPGQLGRGTPGGITSLSKYEPARQPVAVVRTCSIPVPVEVEAGLYVWVQKVVLLDAGRNV